MAKYGMSMCALGMTEEFRPLGIAVNALWPQTGVFLCLLYVRMCSCMHEQVYSILLHGIGCCVFTVLSVLRVSPGGGSGHWGFLDTVKPL